jgi:hypothetical protein
VTLGTDYVYTYVISPTGAIGKQASQINTQLYSGGDCGTTGGAILDHSGQDVYVLLNNAMEDGSGVCTAYQTFMPQSSDERNLGIAFLGVRTEGTICFSPSSARASSSLETLGEAGSGFFAGSLLEFNSKAMGADVDIGDTPRCEIGIMGSSLEAGWQRAVLPSGSPAPSATETARNVGSVWLRLYLNTPAGKYSP